MDQAAKVDRDVTTPFLLKVFYRTGAFHRFAIIADVLPGQQHH